MQIRKAVITAAGRNQRALPLQSIVDRDGVTKSVLRIILDEVLRAEIDEIAVVITPGDAAGFVTAAGDLAARVTLIEQHAPRGYGHAIACARDFVGDHAFLHLVGDHLYLSDAPRGCAQQLVELAHSEACAVSAVQASREHLLPYYGVVGGRRVAGRHDVYEIETVVEKPTPTEAEQRLAVAGLRTGHYLCFFGMHVLTPTVMDILAAQLHTSAASVSLSAALAELAGRERYLALADLGTRYDVGVRYGLLSAQLALALGGRDRDEVLTMLIELLAQRRA